MAGYSGTPLAKKLGIKPDWLLYVENGPEDYLQLLDPLPGGVTWVEPLTGKVNMIHLFTKEAAELAAKLPRFLKRIVEDGVIWVSWPKKAAKIPTDVTEDVIRDVALPLGLVDTKV